MNTLLYPEFDRVGGATITKQQSPGAARLNIAGVSVTDVSACAVPEPQNADGLPRCIRR